MERVATDIDDVLATIPLVQWNDALADRLFSRLVDLLLEGMAGELQASLDAGELTMAAFGRELRALAFQCRTVGLLEA